MRDLITLIENAQDDKLFGPIFHRTKSDLTNLSHFDLSKASPTAVLGPAIYASFGDSNWNMPGSKRLSGYVRGRVIDLTAPLPPEDADRLSALLGRRVADDGTVPLLSLEKRYGSIAAGLKAAGYAAAIHPGPGSTGNHVAVFDPSFIVRDKSGSRASIAENVTGAQVRSADEWDKMLPLAGPVVSGLRVRTKIDNLGSIDASFEDSFTLNGVREVPFSLFVGPDPLTHRVRDLMAAIEEHGEITPLIVAIDSYNGPYILEGAHRYDALQHLGKETFPALVVFDNDDGYFE